MAKRKNDKQKSTKTRRVIVKWPEIIWYDRFQKAIPDIDISMTDLFEIFIAKRTTIVNICIFFFILTHRKRFKTKNSV